MKAKCTRPPLRSIFQRALREQRRTIFAWSAGLVSFSLIMLAMYPTIRNNTGFAKLLDAYPEPLKKLFNFSDYTTAAGYLRTEVFSFMAPLLIAIFAILWGSDLIAGEEERRTIDLLMANPVSRRRVVLEKWLALLTGVVVLSMILEAMLGAIGPLFKLHVGWLPLSAEVAGSGLFALAMGSLALAIGAATGSRAVARGVATIVAVAMYLVTTLAQIVNVLRSIEPLSLWYHALGSDPLTTGFHPVHLLVVIASISVIVALAVLLFDRRDLAV